MASMGPRYSKDSTKDVTISDVASILKNGFFLVTGSTSAEGSPLVFSLDGITPEPDEDTQRNALIYIASLPTFSTDKNLDYCFVVDRRKSSWTCVRKLITLIATSFNRPVKEIVLLQPSGFIQRRWSSSETIKLQQDFPKLQVVIMDDTESLVRKFGEESLSSQLGGSLDLNVDSFIQQRMSIDSLETNCVDLEERVKELILDDAQSDFDIPNDVASTEALLNEHAETKNNLSDEITNIKNQGEIVLQCFKDEVKNLPATQQMLHIQEVQKLTARLEDLEEAIRDYWEKEESKLQECMRLREFHEEFKSLQQNLNKLSDALVSVRDFISSVEEATNNVRILSKIDIESQSLLARANTVAKEWGGKLTTTDEITVNTVTPKCEELVRLHGLCTESLTYKQMLADKQSTLYVHIDAARQWLADEDTSLFEPLPEGLEIDDVTSLDGQLKQIDCQLAIGKFLDILSFDSFMLTYSTALNEDSTVKVKEVYEQVMELMARYELRRSLLYEEIARLTAPIRHAKSIKGRSKAKLSSIKDKLLPTVTVTTGDNKKSPESDGFSVDGPSFKNNRLRHSSKRSVNGGTSDSTSIYSECSTISTPVTEARHLHRTTQRSMSITSDGMSPISFLADDMRSQTDDQHSESSELASESSDQVTEMTRQITEMSMDSGFAEKSSENRKRKGSIKAIKGMFSRRSSSAKKGSSTLSAMRDDTSSLASLTVNKGVFQKSLTMEEETNMAKVRSNLVNELIATEEEYISNLNHIIEFYMRPIAEDDDSVPIDLYANQSMIFSNLEEISDFSSQIFLHELQESMNSASMIASVFKSRCTSLQKYKTFCTSRSKADVLLRKLADEPFLAERYRQQGHQKSLCDQLVLPARRVVYYNHFLQAMFKNLKDDEEAQRDISLVIKELTDTVQTADNLLHQVNIDGYNVDLSTHGSLLHQGRVLVAHDKKSHHRKASDFSSKLKPRHVFLYEKALVFCRVHEDKSHHRPYSYMHAIKLSETRLETQAESSSNKFIFRSNNESILLHCEMSAQQAWMENIICSLDSCNEDADEDFSSPLHQSSFNTPSSQSSTSQKQKHSMHMDDDDIILEQDPDIDMFNLDDDLLDQLSPSGKEINHNTSILDQYMLKEDYDNDLMLDRGDVVECVEIRKDMMKVQIPGTGITSWMPTDVLLPYD